MVKKKNNLPKSDSDNTQIEDWMERQAKDSSPVSEPNNETIQKILKSVRTEWKNQGFHEKPPSEKSNLFSIFFRQGIEIGRWKNAGRVALAIAVLVIVINIFDLEGIQGMLGQTISSADGEITGFGLGLILAGIFLGLAAVIYFFKRPSE